VRLDKLWIADFRNYTDAELAPAPDGLTVVIGDNGEGKTNLLEAIAYLALLESFRGVPKEALVRTGAERAVVRAEGERSGRRLLVEAELSRSGRDRVLVNRQPLRRTHDLTAALLVTVFSPDDLSLVKGGPAERRRYLDATLGDLHPGNNALRAEVDRILRQRTALLRQSAGRLTPEVAVTLDVWDTKLATSGTALAEAREALVARLEPEVAKAYGQVAGAAADVRLRYARTWEGPLADALARARDEDLRRGVTTVGPHRDELVLTIGSLPARTQASQGEQRSLALALRLAAHAAVTEAAGSPPLLLLDDVFSELDPGRADALLVHLPAGQALLTTAGVLPPAARPAAPGRIGGGRIL